MNRSIVVQVPPTFYWDHADRIEESGEVVKATKRYVEVAMTPAEAYELYDDAAFYCDPSNGYAADYPGLVASARATAKKLRDLGYHVRPEPEPEAVAEVNLTASQSGTSVTEVSQSTPKEATMNREQWLTEATERLRPLFIEAGLSVPEIRVSVGWPSKGATSNKNRTIGQCWYGESAEDGLPQVFISPVLSEPVDVLGTLVHEMLHAALPTDTGHKGAFVTGMKAVGLVGKPTATSVGSELEARLRDVAEALGEFPHAKLNPVAKPKQSTRLIKAMCADCGYTVRVTRKWLDEVGAPICPCNNESMEEA